MEALVPREDIVIPDIVESLESLNDEPYINGGQTVANRNCIRAVIINSPDLFIKCVKARAHISSIMERQGPDY